MPSIIDLPNELLEIIMSNLECHVCQANLLIALCRPIGDPIWDYFGENAVVSCSASDEYAGAHSMVKHRIKKLKVAKTIHQIRKYPSVQIVDSSDAWLDVATGLPSLQKIYLRDNNTKCIEIDEQITEAEMQVITPICNTALMLAGLVDDDAEPIVTYCCEARLALVKLVSMSCGRKCIVLARRCLDMLPPGAADGLNLFAWLSRPTPTFFTYKMAILLLSRNIPVTSYTKCNADTKYGRLLDMIWDNRDQTPEYILRLLNNSDDTLSNV